MAQGAPKLRRPGDKAFKSGQRGRTRRRALRREGLPGPILIRGQLGIGAAPATGGIRRPEPAPAAPVKPPRRRSSFSTHRGRRRRGDAGGGRGFKIALGVARARGTVHSNHVQSVREISMDEYGFASGLCCIVYCDYCTCMAMERWIRYDTLHTAVDDSHLMCVCVLTKERFTNLAVSLGEESRKAALWSVEGRYSRTMSSWRIAAGQVGEKSSGGGAGNGPAIAAFPSSFPCGIAQLAEEGGRGPSSFLPLRPAARSFSPVAFPSVGRSVPVVVTHTVRERSGASRGREGFASPRHSAVQLAGRRPCVV
jgi:hypothetical protein